MNDYKTQLKWATEKLLQNGMVSRNDALKHFITRLGSRIWDLRQDGWDFEIERKGGDYIYKSIGAPKQLELLEKMA